MTYRRLVLTGGVDVDPSRYGETKHPKCGRTDPDRDAVEIQFVKWAIEEGKPVLAVCRGFQVLNVAFGGTLFQDVGSQLPKAMKHDFFPQPDGRPPRDYLSHQVQISPGSRLAQLHRLRENARQ